jgi:alanine-synthesizing transaminase
VKALGTIKGYYDYGLFQAIQIAAIVALRHTDAAVEAQSRIYQARRDLLLDGLRKQGWQVPTPRAGMFVWGRIPEPWVNRISSVDFAMLMLDQANVALSPGSGFGDAGVGHCRMALVENENRLKQAVRQMGRVMG